MAFNFSGGSLFGSSSVPVAGSGSSLGLNNNSSTNAPTGQPQPLGEKLSVPTFNDVLPARSIWYKIDGLLRTITSSSSDDASESKIDDAFRAKKELIELLKNLESPNSCAQRLLLRNHTNSILEKVSPDNALRQRLQQQPLVLLSIEQPDGTVIQQEANITPSMLHDICLIADDLMVPEIVAISLYHQASSSEVPFKSKFVQSILRNSSVTPNPTSIPWMAREIYYSQSSLILHSCLSLLQNRLRESSTESSLNPITEATDYLLQSGLITNLIQIVRDYTSRIDTILVENSEGQPTPGSFLLSSSPTAYETSTHFWRNEVVLQACYRERQIAVECLYFIAYSTQMESAEVIALIDLLRDISNSCIILDPFADVPDPMEPIPLGTGTISSSSFNLSTTAPWLTQQPQREKDPLVWERELVKTAMKTGQPQLLQCGCAILVTIFSAFGDKAVLMDRTNHVPNGFGVGNALFPPGSSSIGGLDIIQQYLNRDSIVTWKRPDILGLVLASYAMLLESSPSRSVNTNGNIAQSFQECIVVSLELKSFSFARLSLIPALRANEETINDYTSGIIDSNCNVTEFFLASIADFASNYMDVFSKLDQPFLSREKWEREVEADLKARREQQELEQSLRGNFPKWSNPAALNSSANEIPNQVDLLTRPDCIDDVVAFSTEIGFVGPEYAIQFWCQKTIISEDEGMISTKLVPSRAVIWLQELQRNDESLRPVFLSFLSALALATSASTSTNRTGADEVYGLISKENDDGSGWSNVVEIFRWYIRQLSPDASTVRTPSASATSSGGSTAYYYLEQDETNGSDIFMDRTERSKSGEAVSQSRPRELGEANEFILLSNIAILTNVAKLSPIARSLIISINLPIIESDGEMVGQESVIAILFALAVMPLSPDIRGAVFQALAILISVEGLDKDAKEFVQLAALKGWELIEDYQFLPINMLQQYPSMHDPSHHGSPNMSFPPSSSALAITKNVPLWFSPDPRYALMYEMEFVESRRGCYPSTCGFLELLSSLFSVVGSPAGLGQNWRVRTGCAPYIEHKAEKTRLTTIALKVMNVVLTRYHILKVNPPVELSTEKLTDFIFKSSENSATHELVLPELVQAVTVRPNTEDAPHMMNDYSTSEGAAYTHEIASNQPQSTTNSPIPQAKTPGFSIFAGMLSSKRQILFDAVISPLIDYHKAPINFFDSHHLSLVYALYVATPPTFASAKDGARRTWPKNTRELLLTSLRPSAHIEEQYGSTVEEISSVLKILCGILAKEESFRYQISLTRQATYVPVLRFSKKSSLPTTVDVKPSKLSYLLISSEMVNGVVSTIVDLVGFFSKNVLLTANIAAMATAISFYIEKSASRQQALELFSYRNPRNVHGGLIHSITTRFLLAASTARMQHEATLLVFILERLLSDLRANTSSGTLGNIIFSEKTAHKQSDSMFLCLGAILQVLDNVDYAVGEFSSEVATLCYETFYRLISIGKGKHEIETALIVAEYLRARDFWSLAAFKLCSKLLSLPREEMNIQLNNAIHSVAWLLKGTACELRLLSGISKNCTISTGLERLLAPHPKLFKELIDVTFSHQGLVDYALSILPIERPIFSAIAEAPPDEESVIDAKYSMHGAPEVVDGYHLLNSVRLSSVLKAENLAVKNDGLQAWVEQWNQSVYADCSSAHLSNAIRLLIESSIACSCNLGFDSIAMAGRTTIYQLISCMTPLEDQMRNVESIDTTYFTTACRNLASAACMISFAIGDEWRVNKFPEDEFDFVNLSELIIRAIACSVADKRSFAEFIRIRERIAALSGVLLPIIRARQNLLKREDSGQFWFQAAVVLAQLTTKCVIFSQNKKPTTPSNDDLVMQTCLCEILENFACSGSSNAFSTCRAILTHTSSNSQTTPIQGILELIKSFDENASLLVQRLISIAPGFDELFIASGILDALKHAADEYCVEEKRFISLMENNVNYSTAQIQVPIFLVGHFEILSVLMTSQVDPSLLQDSLPKIIATLGTYKHLFERLVDRFPFGGDTLYAMLRCITQANLLLTENSQRLSSSENVTNYFLPFHNPVAKLAIHIAQYPLPTRMLDPLPSRLKSPTLVSGLVSVSQSKLQSWWDTQEKDLVDVHDICRVAALGMDLVRFGMLMIRHSASRSTFDEFSLSICLYRCANAAIKIESAMGSSNQGLRTTATEQAIISDLKALRSKVIDTLEAILFLSLSYIRDQILTSDMSRVESCRRTFTFALDQTSLDFLNINSKTVLGGDENQPGIISDLCREVRLLLNSKSLPQNLN